MEMICTILAISLRMRKTYVGRPLAFASVFHSFVLYLFLNFKQVLAKPVQRRHSESISEA